MTPISNVIIFSSYFSFLSVSLSLFLSFLSLSPSMVCFLMLPMVLSFYSESHFLRSLFLHFLCFPHLLGTATAWSCPLSANSASAPTQLQMNVAAEKLITSLTPLNFKIHDLECKESPVCCLAIRFHFSIYSCSTSTEQLFHSSTPKPLTPLSLVLLSLPPHPDPFTYISSHIFSLLHVARQADLHFCTCIVHWTLSSFSCSRTSLQPSSLFFQALFSTFSGTFSPPYKHAMTSPIFKKQQ